MSNTPIHRITFAAALAALLALAGCGGGSHKSESKSTTTASSTTHAPPPTTVPKHRRRAIHELVVVAKAKKPPAAQARVKPGDIVVFSTTISGTAKPSRVRLSLTQGPASKLTVTASSKGRKSTVTLTSATGAPVTLIAPHYSCDLPPAASFCPARHESTHGQQVSAEFNMAPTTPVLLTATIGPVPGAATVKPPSVGTLSVPTFDVTETVHARSPSAPKPTTPVTPTSTASAKPGDVVVLSTRLTGDRTGAPQPLTVSFDQGPAKKLTVTAGVAGGTPSKATVASGGDSKITLVNLRYSCYLPPTPTFCPVSHVRAAQHHYTLTFLASPLTPVAIVATAQAG